MSCKLDEFLCVYLFIFAFSFIFNVINTVPLPFGIMAFQIKIGRRDSFFSLRLCGISGYGFTFSAFAIFLIWLFWNVRQNVRFILNVLSHVNSSKRIKINTMNAISNKRPAMKTQIRNGMVCLINEYTNTAQHACWPWIQFDYMNSGIPFSGLEHSIKFIWFYSILLVIFFVCVKKEGMYIFAGK